VACELCKNIRTNPNAVWDAESGGSREHVDVGVKAPLEGALLGHLAY